MAGEKMLALCILEIVFTKCNLLLRHHLPKPWENVYATVMNSKQTCTNGSNEAPLRTPFFLGSRNSLFVVLATGIVSFATELVLGAREVDSLAEADGSDDVVWLATGTTDVEFA